MRRLLHRFSKYLVAAIILAIPLYPKFPLFRIPNTYVSIRLEDFLVSLTLAVVLVVHLKDFKKAVFQRAFTPILIFLAAGFVSYLSGVYVSQTIDWKMGLFHLARRVEYLSLFAIGYFAIKNRPKWIHFFLKLIPVVIFLAFIYGLGQRYFSWPIIITQNEEYSKGVALRYVEGSHINSTFAGHYDLATYLVLFLPYILLLSISKRRISIPYLTIYFFGVWLLVNSASRISLLSFMGASVISIFLVKQYKRGLILIAISLLFIGFSSNLIRRYERVFTIIKSSFSHVTTTTVPEALAQDLVMMRRSESPEPTPTPIPAFEDRSTSIRLNVEWPRALRAFSKNPLIGSGYSSITLATDNDYLRLLGEVGIVGFLSFFLIFATAFLPVVRRIKTGLRVERTEDVFIAGFFGGVLGVLLNAAFIDVFEASKLAITFWLFSGILYARLVSDT